MYGLDDWGFFMSRPEWGVETRRLATTHFLDLTTPRPPRPHGPTALPSPPRHRPPPPPPHHPAANPPHRPNAAVPPHRPKAAVPHHVANAAVPHHVTNVAVPHHVTVQEPRRSELAAWVEGA